MKEHVEQHRDESGTLEASGLGEVRVPPNLALVRLAVFTEAKTAAEASEQNALVMKAVATAVQALPHRTIESTGMSVQPITTWDAEARRSIITGFRADNGISVHAAVDEAGAIFDAGIRAGANQSSGIEFRLDDERPHREEALRIAVKAAHADANVVATTADLVLDGVERIDVDPASGPVLLRMDLARAESAATPVFPGALTVSARVRIVFRHRPRA